jgi:hypothetical protein
LSGINALPVVFVTLPVGIVTDRLDLHRLIIAKDCVPLAALVQRFFAWRALGQGIAAGKAGDLITKRFEPIRHADYIYSVKGR